MASYRLWDSEFLSHDSGGRGLVHGDSQCGHGSVHGQARPELYCGECNPFEPVQEGRLVDVISGSTGVELLNSAGHRLTKQSTQLSVGFPSNTPISEGSCLMTTSDQKVP